MRVLATSDPPGGLYDGVSHDVHVTAMPGFIFSPAVLLVYSCFGHSTCVAEFSFAADTESLADMTVTVTSSDDSIAAVSPSVLTVHQRNATSANATVQVSYVRAGTACLSFAGAVGTPTHQTVD